MSTRHRSLYGDATGNWAIIETPEGVVPPPTLTTSRPRQGMSTLTYLGPPADVVTKLGYRIQNQPGRIKAQEEVARLLGVTQQSVSRYMRGTEPELSDEGWRALVTAHIDGSAGGENGA